MLLQLLPQWGGMVLVAGFAWLLLRGTLKQQVVMGEQQKKLGSLLENHLTKLLDRQAETNKLLAEICDHMREHEAYSLQVGATLLERTKG